MRIVMLGAPGSGKGTQAKRVAAEYEIPHIASGDLYRAEIAADTELGRQVAPLLAAGSLVPDEITIPLVRRMIENEGANGFILDGYPRNLVQASALDGLLKRIGQPLDVALMLHVDAELLFQRLAGRAAAEGRKDDNPETVRERLRVYEAQTAPVVKYYRELEELTEVDGVGDPDQVFQRILSAIRARGVAV